jgi:hypothetical protein
MTAERESSKALEEAFRAALMLTGCQEAAEYAVLGGITALEFGHIADDILLVETAKAAIQCRADFPGQSEPALLQHTPEFQRLLLLAPISRDCFMSRVLLGINVGTCSSNSAPRDRGLRRGAVGCAARAATPRNSQRRALTRDRRKTRSRRFQRRRADRRQTTSALRPRPPRVLLEIATSSTEIPCRRAASRSKQRPPERRLLELLF